MSPDDWATLRFEATRFFTPSTPIGAAELFAGRRGQISTLINTIGEPGRHAILYGEPGVGKTSVAQIIQYLIPHNASRVIYVREPAYSNDTFSSLWLRIFSQIELILVENGQTTRHNLSEIYAAGVSQGDVKRALYLSFGLNDIPVIVIDEYNVIKDENVAAEMAETIKSLSDDGINATIIVVGVSDSVSELVRGHNSIIRCSEEVLMPRMDKNEIKEVIETRISKLGMKIDGNAKWKIINLSKGLPAFAQSLGRGSVVNAIDSRRLTVTEQDVDAAISTTLKSSQNTLRDDYELSTKSSQDRARFRQVLTACALAKADESGYFFPKQVQAPLNSILGKDVDFADFHKIIKDFTSEKRGSILQQKGADRQYRYRFRNPAMQPFVIMKGIEEGFLNEAAKLALSSPEQADLFSTV